MTRPDPLDSTTHPSAQDLSAFGLGQPTLVDSETIAEHLATCAQCEARTLETHTDRFLDLLRTAAESGVADSPVLHRVVPGYEVLHELGRGGAGVVFLARQPGLGRLVALKQLRTGTLASPIELVRFRREAETLARLDHPNIVRVYESGEQDGIPYLALEYVAGMTLAQKLQTGPLDPRSAAELIETITRAVECSHAAGIIHRDLKPGNILLQPDPHQAASLGVPKITDFGLARTLDTLPHTLSGTLLGTPAYMAPEQISGPAEALGPGADLFALGAILYEALTGSPPFQGETVVDTLDLVRNATPIPPRKLQPRIPFDLELICLKCLEKSASDRYPTASALAADLQRFRQGERIRIGGVRQTLRRTVRGRSRMALVTLSSVVAVAVIAMVAWLGIFSIQPRPSHDQQATAVAPGAALPGLTTWLRADQGVELDSAGRVRKWSDQSPNGSHDAAQLIAGYRPTLIPAGSNSPPAIRFDGFDDSFDLAGQLLESQQFTIVAVTSFTIVMGRVGSHALLSNWDGSKTRSSVFLGIMNVNGAFARFTDDLGGMTDENIQLTRRALITNPADRFIITARSSATDAEIYIGRQRMAATGRPLSRRDLTGVWRIGTQGGGHEFWSGDLAEILVYDRALDPSEVQALWKYLHDKHFPGSPL